MSAKVILNPYSNRWNARARWPEAEAALKAAGIEFELAVSEYAGHSLTLAEEAARAGCAPIIVAGGDGTIGEVVNGLAQANPTGVLGPLGLIPLGTANDLFDSLKLPRDITAAVNVIKAGKTRNMDIGAVNGKYFANNSGVGFEPSVTVKQNKLTRVKGIGRYLLAALQTIMDNPSWHAHMEWDGGSFEGRFSLASIGNGPRTGGLFFMSPHADLFDGQMTVTYGYRKTRWGILTLMPKIMQPAGTFVHEPGISEVNMRWLKIHLDHPSPVHTDGELFPEELTDFEYRIEPGRLQILVA